MARRIVHELIDDLDGTVLEAGAGETVLFSLDGVAYEIDLTQQNASALRDAFTQYKDAGRQVSGRGRSGAAAGDANARRRRSGQTDYAPVRAWAKENGHQVSERGRVSASVMDAYNAAH